jgi:hypothetical protein
MSDAHVAFASIKHKFFISFVDCIIGQMNEVIF